MTDRIVSDAQRAMADAARPKRSLASRVVSFMSGSFPVGMSGLAERDRQLVADHLDESARRALSAQIRMDALMFGLSMAEAEFTTPAVSMVRAIAAAVRAGDDSAPVVGGLDSAQKYGVSGVLEASRDRAQRDGADAIVSDITGRLWAAWDRWSGVEGSPGERSWHISGRPAGEIVY